MSSLFQWRGRRGNWSRGRKANWLLFLVGFAIAGTAVVVWAAPFRRRVIDSVGSLFNANFASMTQMPGKTYAGPLPELSAEEAKLRDQLKADVQKLAIDIGERNTSKPEKLNETAAFVEKSLIAAGYKVARLPYEAKGRACLNLVAELAGQKTPGEVVIVGAHYDCVPGAPGANDNGSGTAGLLTLARLFAHKKPDRTLRFVAFANEEQPYFQSESMGSLVYARQCKAKQEKITAMLSLETIGYYSDAPGSQHYPFPFSQYYPSTGNFIGFIGNTESKPLVHQSIRTFREKCKFPSEGAAAPASVEGVGWSDQWSFWQVGYPAIMITDTAIFRYPHYHKASDTPDKIDFDRMARVVGGVEKVIDDLTTVVP